MIDTDEISCSKIFSFFEFLKIEELEEVIDEKKLIEEKERLLRRISEIDKKLKIEER